MAFTRVAFRSLPFVQGHHPLERKKVGAHPSVSLLEFAAGFADPNWCTRAHVFHVLQGELTLELEGAREVLGAGESCVIDSGTRHRARNDGSPAVLVFAVSDLSPERPGPSGDPAS